MFPRENSGSLDFDRRAEIVIKISEFEIPPVQDVLLVGKKAPVGPEAVRRMVDAVSPEQYEVVEVDHDIFEAIVIKKSLLKLIPKEKLLPLIMEEGSRIADEQMVMKAQVKISIHVRRAVTF